MKTLKFAENSITAKVKALYGKRLTNRNYDELLNLHSVREIAEYLKTKTAYSEIFEGISSTEELQRGRLENLLFNKLYNDLSKVERFQKAAGNNLYKYFTLQFDISQLTLILNSIKTKSDSYFFSFPVFYNEWSVLDLYALSQAKTYDELSRLTMGTPYHSVLKNVITDYSVTKNPFTVQNCFDTFIDGEFLKLISGEKKKKFQKNSPIAKLYKFNNDVTLVQSLYRLTQFGMRGENVLKAGISEFTQEQIKALTSAGSPAELDEILKTSYLRDIIQTDGVTDIYHRADNLRYGEFAKTLSRLQDADAVTFAYFHLSRNEIRNLIHIIEAVRYGETTEKILPTLIIPCKEGDKFGY